MIKFNKTDAKRLGNIAILSINTSADENAYEQAMMQAGYKFLNSAVLLPDDEFLGLQIARDEAGAASFLVFSSSGSGVADTDYSWMFEPFCKIVQTTRTSVKDIYEGNRKVYQLSYIVGSDNDLSQVSMRGNFNDNVPKYSDDYYFEDGYEPSENVINMDRAACMDGWFMELFNMMMDAGAIIQIVAGISREGMKGHGTVLFSFPQDMPLRIRVMISMAFLHTKAVEVGRADESGNGENFLSDEKLIGCMLMYMEALLKNEASHKESSGNSGKDETTEYSTNTDNNGSGNESPHNISLLEANIDDLELSIRSTCCLKRAGIDTVAKLIELTEEDLRTIRNMGPKSRNEIIETLTFYGLKLKSDNGTVLKEQGNCIDRLNEMIGLDSVKDQIRHMAAYAKMKKDMEEKGLDKLSTSFNMAFLGNPGTAKTTVARIVAGIFQEIGLIKHTKIIETGRSDLVGEYVGHTAVKVQEVFKKAKGGILFIDEAYSLVDDYMNSFGDEAISTLVQEMENNRNEVIVIFAGYPEKMKEFILRNPGLKSRIPFSIYFEDYTAEEMCQIAILEAKKRGFSINPGALDKVKNICETAVGKSEAGNGRFCRNIVESAILEYALREYEKDENADEKTFELLECDFVNTSYEDTVSEKNKIGF